MDAWGLVFVCYTPMSENLLKLAPSPLALLGQDIPLSALSDGRSSSLKTFLFLRWHCLQIMLSNYVGYL